MHGIPYHYGDLRDLSATRLRGGSRSFVPRLLTGLLAAAGCGTLFATGELADGLDWHTIFVMLSLGTWLLAGAFLAATQDDTPTA
jgi:hypothetical protein